MFEGLIAKLDAYFLFSERGSTIGAELRAGTASFLTLSYLLLVNPAILVGAGVAHDDAVLATALSAAISCFIVGIFGNLPFGKWNGVNMECMATFTSSARSLYPQAWLLDWVSRLT